MSIEGKYIGESPIKGIPKKPITFIIKDGSVSKEKLDKELASTIDLLKPITIDYLVEFDGFITDAYVNTNATTNKPNKIYLNSYSGANDVTQYRFIAWNDDSQTYYSNWISYNDILEPTAYGFPKEDGYEPLRKVVYYHPVTNKSYRWSGKGMVVIPDNLALGYTPETAYPGSEGVDLKNQVIAIGRNTTASLNEEKYLREQEDNKLTQRANDSDTIIIEHNKILYPLELTVKGSGIYENGVENDVTVSWVAKRKGTDVTSNTRVSVNGNAVDLGESSFTAHNITESIVFNVNALYSFELLDQDVEIASSKSITVTFVDRMYFGFIEDSTINETIMKNKLIPQDLATSPKGIVTLSSSNKGYIWLCIPNYMSIKKVKMDGQEVPLEMYSTAVSGYKCYRSNHSEPDSYTLEIE